jgi:hypothetical protein
MLAQLKPGNVRQLRDPAPVVGRQATTCASEKGEFDQDRSRLRRLILIPMVTTTQRGVHHVGAGHDLAVTNQHAQAFSSTPGPPHDAHRGQLAALAHADGSLRSHAMVIVKATSAVPLGRMMPVSPPSFTPNVTVK